MNSDLISQKSIVNRRFLTVNQLLTSSPGHLLPFRKRLHSQQIPLVSDARGKNVSGDPDLKAIFHLAEFSVWSEIFFCLKTNWQRVGVKRQKKISFRAENSV